MTDDDLDAISDKRGKLVRKPVFLVTTNTNHDKLSWAEVFRAPRAWLMLLACAGLLISGFLGVVFAACMLVAALLVMYQRQASFPVTLTLLAVGYFAVWQFDAHRYAAALFMLAGLFFFGARYWALAPDNRNPGARHCLLLYKENDFWHTDQYISGRGEVTSVLTANGKPVPSGWSLPVVLSHAGIDQGEESVRIVKTYRRSPSISFPYLLNSTTSTGYCARRLGISNVDVRKPAELADYCETVDAQVGDVQLMAQGA